MRLTQRAVTLPSPLGRRVTIALALLGASLLLPQLSHAQRTDPDAFAYSGALDAGKTVHIYNVNGAITVERTSSGRLEVRAEKRWKKGDPDDVTITRLTARDGDVVVCALWNDAECTDSGIRSQRKQQWNKNNDVSVQFTLRVPDGVHVDLHTVNGAVEVENVSGMVNAQTVNGSVTARSTRGPVSATTVNGSIRATMTSMGREELSYSTVNGGIVLELPESLRADLDISTVNGSVNTDFPVTIQGSISRKRLRGSVGGGGPLLKAKTVNGSVTLRSGS